MTRKQEHDTIFSLPLVPPSGSGQHLSATVDKALEKFSPQRATRQLTQLPEGVWMKRGQKRALALFHAAAERVPAYKSFLKKHRIRPGTIRTFQDFSKLPLVDKDTYLRAYPLEQLCWDGKLPRSQIISVSSGSSGQPFFWPRGQILDMETTLEHELFLTSMFQIDRKSTLCVICFAMGMYVAGPITLNSILQLGRKGYPITAVTPGYSPNDVLAVIPDLAPRYDQVILAGYPPYIKEILDQGTQQGINWSSLDLKFLLAGEGFNESWRNYVAELAGRQDPVTDFVNLYGSADAAVLAHETPASIVIRRLVADNNGARQDLFGRDRLPSFLQYYPEHKYFETVGDELIFTTPGGIPLIRYNIHDSGGILNRRTITERVPELDQVLTQLDRRRQYWHLPFVYVFGKSDQTAILYGANVYPENIRQALEHRHIRHRYTGKIIMYVAPDENKDQRLHIEVECAAKTRPSKYLTDQLTRQLLATLLEVNSEYRVVHRGIGKRTIPIVHLFPFGEGRFHAKTVKHAWARRRG